MKKKSDQSNSNTNQTVNGKHVVLSLDLMSWTNFTIKWNEMKWLGFDR